MFGATYDMQVDVDDDSSYLFNVAMMDARNITSVYAGTNVSFTATDYQDCVADPDCTSQVLTVMERKILDRMKHVCAWIKILRPTRRRNSYPHPI